MEEKTYLNILVQSLNKKLLILADISQLNQDQADALADPNLDPDDFDVIVDKKAALIEQIEQLDAGFDEVYKRVRDELAENPDAYRDDVAKLQKKIRAITDQSVAIQRQEAANKQMMEQKFATVRTQVREVRKSQKVVNQYYKNMMKKDYVEPRFLDNKK